MTQYELQFLRICIKRISQRKITQITQKTASDNIQQNGRVYSIQKVIQATSDRGHTKVTRTRGIQCTCICLFNICFPIFKVVSKRNRHDIESLTEKGNALYKFQNTDHLLSCACLPGVVVIFHSRCFYFNYSKQM